MKNRSLFLFLAVGSFLACKVDVDHVKVSDPPVPAPDAGDVPPIVVPPTVDGGAPPPSDPNDPAHNDGIKNLDETCIDGGGSSPNKCTVGDGCLVASDCVTDVCSYKNVCLSSIERSCAMHLGGDTCGKGEVEEANKTHESCCRSLPVPGYNDPNHPGRTTYLDKYEITAGRMRAFISDVTKRMGKPDVHGWISSNNPPIWNPDWNVFIPSNYETGTVTINRLLLGDPRHDGQTQEVAGPGVILPPAADQTVSVGLNYQFGGKVFADLHGNNCGTYAGAFGFPTYWYPVEVQSKNGEAPRPWAKDAFGKDINPQNWLDVKSMNCATNAMLAAFCAWDGGQLMTAEVFDFVTDSPTDRPQDVSGCGPQLDDHGALLGNIFAGTVQSGGRCAPVSQINATFDAGDVLPALGSPLNNHVYHYPDLGASTSDKTWEIAAPGRVWADAVRTREGDETWMDLAGNLSESTLNLSNGNFALRGRGIGYGSSRSDLNVTLMPGETILRVQRPEAKSALVGGRCMRFK